jgi:hypothetical protein
VLFRSIASIFTPIFLIILLFFSSCKKINESTELGGGLIPPIDNITTFDTILNVQAYNDTFGLATDSQYLDRSDVHFLGLINSDPFFGKTDARLFLELKPTFYKFAFANANPDSLHLDSVVLVLGYVNTYGDSTAAQTVNVYEIDPGVDFRADSAYLIRQNYFTYSNLLGSRTFEPRVLDDSVKAFRDTTDFQLRIKLTNAFGNRLLQYDSTGTTGAYSSDSVFKTKFNGFALQSVSGGNAIMGIDLLSPNTKLAIYYRYELNGKKDTTVAYFGFNGASALNVGASASANYIIRDYAGTPLEASIGGAIPDPIVYLQNSPGTFSIIKIPGLSTLSNRVVHLAELTAEQLYNISDTVFTPPAAVYLDAFDSTIVSNKQFRTIPYSITFDNFGSPQNLSTFSILPRTVNDGLGHQVRSWNFNVSRYVQHILTGTAPYYDLRLYAPFSVNNKFIFPRPDANDISTTFILNPTITAGRVRLLGNNGTGDSNPHRMRLRIVYSKL